MRIFWKNVLTTTTLLLQNNHRFEVSIEILLHLIDTNVFHRNTNGFSYDQQTYNTLLYFSMNMHKNK